MREDRAAKETQPPKVWLPRGPPTPCSLAVAALPTGLRFVLQIAGFVTMELSSSWAGSPSSLKRSSGLPMAYPTPSALQTTSAYWPALRWKSPPYDSLPGEESFSSRRATWIDLFISSISTHILLPLNSFITLLTNDSSRLTFLFIFRIIYSR